jgi:hypothetical protein
MDALAAGHNAAVQMIDTSRRARASTRGLYSGHPRKAHPSEFQILAQLPNLPQELRSTQVIVRFFVRMIVMVVFADCGSIGFSRSLAALLGMSTILSAVIGAMRREPLLDAVLNHWDETMAYAALCCLVMEFD